MKRKIRLVWDAACVAVLVLGIAGCGGEDDASAVVESDRGYGPAVATLTEEEAAVLAEFRAGRQAQPAAPASAETPPPDSDASSVPARVQTSAAIADDSENISAGIDSVSAIPAKPNPNPAAAADSASTPAPTVFAQHHITDPEYNHMVAMTVLYPEAWKVEGGITRLPPAYYNVSLLTDIKFTAPDGRQAHFFPSMSFEFGGQPMPGQPSPQLFSPTANGNMYFPLPETPGRWLMQLAKLNPDPTVSHLKLVSEEPEAQLTQQLQQQSAPLYQMIQQNKDLAMQTGIDTAFDTQATVVTLRYTQDGIELEETVLVAWHYFVNLWHGQVTGGTWGVPMMFSARGPVGSRYMLDPELMAIFHSVRPNPQWLQKQQAYWNELARIRNQGQADRNRDWQAHNAKMQKIRSETSDIIASGYANRVASQDRLNEKFVDTISDVTAYDTPDGDTVKLPSYYDNVYTDGNDRFILTNDPFYNPDGDLNMTGSWTRVQPRP